MHARLDAPIVVNASTNELYADLENQEILDEPSRCVLRGLPDDIRETAALGFRMHAPTVPPTSTSSPTPTRTASRRSPFLRAASTRHARWGVEDQGWAAWLVLAGAFGRRVMIYGDGKRMRHVLYVDDVVAAYSVGGAPDFAVSRWREFSELVRALGHEPPHVTFGPVRQGDRRVNISDMHRGTADFGSSPSVSPREGLAQLAQRIVSAAPSLDLLLAGR